MNTDDLSSIQTFRVRIVGYIYTLTVINFIVIVIFLMVKKNFILFLTRFNNSEWGSSLWAFCVIIFSVFMAMLFIWGLISKIALKIIVSPKELRFESTLPFVPNLILFNGKKIQAGYITIPWNEITGISYNIYRDIFCVNYGNRFVIDIGFARHFYNLKKLFPTISLYLPSLKYDESSRSFITKMPDKEMDPLCYSQDQLMLLGFNTLKKYTKDYPNEIRFKRALFSKYFADDTNFNDEHAYDAAGLGKELLQFSPDDESILTAMGNIFLWFSDNKPEATKYYERALEANPLNGLLYKKLLACYCMQEQFQKAKKLLEHYQAKQLDYISVPELDFINKTISAGRLIRSRTEDIESFGSDDWPES
jgi:hypothetical protein